MTIIKHAKINRNQSISLLIMRRETIPVEVTMKTKMNSGTMELRILSQRYMTEGLMIAGLFHFMLIGSYQLYSSLTNTEELKFSRIPRDNMIIDYFPPSINRNPILPQLNIARSILSSVGIPIPIPDPEINPDATIATQTEMSKSTGNEVGIDGGTGTIISDGTSIGEEELPPEPFIPVQVMPVPISNPAPAYPDIAKRAGVEGTVYIKMWVTKEGRVKQAEVVKSTSELFNQAAIEAALMWTFTPAIMNNGPVSVWVTVPFKFRLNNR